MHSTGHRRYICQHEHEMNLQVHNKRLSFSTGSDKDLNSETVSNAILSQKEIALCTPKWMSDKKQHCRRVGERKRRKLTKKDQFQLKKHYAEIIQNFKLFHHSKWSKKNNIFEYLFNAIANIDKHLSHFRKKIEKIKEKYSRANSHK